MRILYSHYLSQDDHPASQMVSHIANELREFGHDVRIHRSFGPAQQTVGQPAKSSRLKQLAWFAKAYSRNTKMKVRDLDAIRTFKPDIVLCRQDAYCFSMPAACRQSAVPLVTYADAPVAYETRHYDTSGRWHPRGLVEHIEKWCLKQSRAVVTVSQTAARILDRYRIAAPIAVIANGVNLHQYSRLRLDEVAQARTALGIKTPLVAGFVGSFRPFHGLSTLVELIKGTADRSDLTWLLVGDGPGRSGVEQIVRDCRNVKFLGRQNSHEIPRLLSLMDVLVCPQARTNSEFYFCPLKILEGMAAGVPVLASDQGDIPQCLDYGRAGCLVSSGRSSDWLASLNGLLCNPDRRNSLRVSALQQVRQFTWRDCARKVERELAKCLQQGKRISLRYSICDSPIQRSASSTLVRFS